MHEVVLHMPYSLETVLSLWSGGLGSCNGMGLKSCVLIRLEGV